MSVRRQVAGIWLTSQPKGQKTWWHTDDKRYWVIRAITRDPWEVHIGNPMKAGSKTLWYGCRTMEAAAKLLAEHIEGTKIRLTIPEDDGNDGGGWK